MNRCILLAMLMFFLIHCQKSENLRNSSGEPLSATTNLHSTDSSLYTKMELSYSGISKWVWTQDDDQRAKIFIDTAPTEECFGVGVSSVTLFYIDAELVKIARNLEENITDTLLHTYRKVKFLSRNREEKNHIDEGLIVAKDGKKTLNENVNSYQLNWSEGKIIYYLKVFDNNTPKRRVQFIEQVSSFDLDWPRN